MGTPSITNFTITDRLLRNWIRCPRRAWLDLHGDNEQRVWTAHSTLQLNNQQQVLAKLLPQRAFRGIEACKRGEVGVIGLRLKGKGPAEQLLEAHPLLLQRVNGKSLWGQFAYRPVIVRQGRKFTREHRLSLSLLGFLLEFFQGSSVQNGLVIGRTHRGLELQPIKLTQKLKVQLFDVLDKLKQDLKKSSPPPITSDRRKCSLCSWRGICNSEAAKEGHLSEVSGIGARRKEMLQQIGINSLQDLANAEPIYLAKYLSHFGPQHSDLAKSLIAQAKVQRDYSVERFDHTLALPELLEAPGVLLYDIESDPDIKEDFLHGFLSIRKSKDDSWDLKNAKYHPLLMLEKDKESRHWNRLKKKLACYPSWPILHYGETESLAICRLAQRQGIEEEELKILQSRLIDIHKRVKQHWLIPLNSYGLKAIASWLGFHWNPPGADGARALLWWRQWKASELKHKRKSTKLLKIFQYNHDDCLATWTVTRWILEQDKKTLQGKAP